MKWDPVRGVRQPAASAATVGCLFVALVVVLGGCATPNCFLKSDLPYGSPFTPSAPVYLELYDGASELEVAWYHLLKTRLLDRGVNVVEDPSGAEYVLRFAVLPDEAVPDSQGMPGLRSEPVLADSRYLPPPSWSPDPSRDTLGVIALAAFNQDDCAEGATLAEKLEQDSLTDHAHILIRPCWESALWFAPELLPDLADDLAHRLLDGYGVATDKKFHLRHERSNQVKTPPERDGTNRAN